MIYENNINELFKTIHWRHLSSDVEGGYKQHILDAIKYGKPELEMNVSTLTIDYKIKKVVVSSQLYGKQPVELDLTFFVELIRNINIVEK